MIHKLFNYEITEPEDNTFVDICADITHKCNMTCKNCYIPSREPPDMDLDRFKDFMDRLGGRAFVRIIGAEPTMSPNCANFIRAVYEHGRTDGRKHSCTLVTNGLRLSHAKYLNTLIEAGLRSVTLSLNGVDNDDWYEQIDEMRCAKKKLKALRNIVDRKMNLNTGTIIIPEINYEAPARLKELIEKEKINNVMMRIKNVGQLGRYQKDKDGNIKLEGLVKLCADQFNVSEDYIWSFHGVPYYNKFSEKNTILFPLKEGNKLLNRGRWVKITNWDTDNEGGIPDPGSKRRGRITQDFKLAPFYEHTKENEGGY
jgi:molybdenum cofactor biosynthesis enzyme MoaA